MGRAEDDGHGSLLVAALAARGLLAAALPDGRVQVANPAGAPDGRDGLGQVLAPGLRQEVACRPSEVDGCAWWHWVWSGPGRHSPPEFEPLCRVDQVEHAADRIARVLAVPFDGAGAG